jgi:hypothetical protein
VPLSYLTVGFCISLHGPESFMLDLKALWKLLHKGMQDADCPFVIIPMLGQFKGEDHHRHVRWLG